MESEISSSKNVDLKPMLCELSPLSRPDGSATFSLGETVITAAVYGPTEVKIQKELATEANVEVVYKPKTGLPGCTEKFQEHLIKNTCKSAILSTQYPRTHITIVLQELQNSGSLLSSCVNASCLALIDSSVAMKCLVAAVSCILTDDGTIIVDPTSTQEKEARASFFFAFDSRDERVVVSSHSEGTFSREDYQKCLILCRDASKKIVDFYRSSITRKFSK